MINVRASALALLVLATACGDDNNENHPDAFVIHDASPDARVCSSATPGMLDFVGYRKFQSGDEVVQWAAPLAAPTNTDMTFEFWSGIEPNLAGTFDLTAGKQNNYKTCAICLYAVETDSQGQALHTYFQSGGSVTLTEDPFTNKHMIASITDLQLEEVTIADSDATSTPVPGGACLSFGNVTADHDRVPNAWTCAKTDYDAGTSCNCVCGLPDPDCNSDANAVVGCTAGQACFNDACVMVPANDTCATAIPLTIGTPVTGTTAGAKRNYDAGFETMACIGFAEPGPDVVYSVVLTANQQITVSLTNLAADYDGAVALVGPGAATLCDANPITTCVAGMDNAFEGGNETFMYTATTAGTYYIVVDGFSASSAGTFTLNVTSM